MCVKEMERESVKEGYRESVWLKEREGECACKWNPRVRSWMGFCGWGHRGCVRSSVTVSFCEAPASGAGRSSR